jgi:ubiquinone/menaquinone biosynthesis C-methylase UbiE
MGVLPRPGDVLEGAIGTGRNLAYYPAGVRVIGIDLSLAMLAVARRRADELGITADLRHGDAENLPSAMRPPTRSCELVTGAGEGTPGRVPRFSAAG